MNKDKIDNLCKYLWNNSAKQYPILNGQLADSTDYIKNGYLKMLAVIMQQSGIVSKAQLEIFKRIISGANTEKTAEDYLRMALDIEIEDYINFSDELKKLQLKYRWVLDAIIITCVQKGTQDQLILLAQFCESYKVSKNELRYIATMAKAIINMKVEDYVTAYGIKEDTIPDTVFSDYMYLISNKCVCSNEYMTIFQPTQKEDITVQVLEKIKEVNTPYIRIIGAEINLNNYDLKFLDKEKVILENCCFVGGSKYPISFSSCKEVIINNCSFENFSSRTLIIGEAVSVSINGCKFTNCKLKYSDKSIDWSVLGAVIYSLEPLNVGRLDLINTSFTDCGGINESNYFRSAFICNIKSYVDSCNFTNCWHLNNNIPLGIQVDPDSQSRTMFTKGSYATNCKYENSALFN